MIMLNAEYDECNADIETTGKSDMFTCGSPGFIYSCLSEILQKKLH